MISNRQAVKYHPTQAFVTPLRPQRQRAYLSGRDSFISFPQSTGLVWYPRANYAFQSSNDSELAPRNDIRISPRRLTFQDERENDLRCDRNDLEGNLQQLNTYEAQSIKSIQKSMEIVQNLRQQKADAIQRKVQLQRRGLEEEESGEERQRHAMNFQQFIQDKQEIINLGLKISKIDQIFLDQYQLKMKTSNKLFQEAENIRTYYLQNI